MSLSFHLRSYTLVRSLAFALLCIGLSLPAAAQQGRLTGVLNCGIATVHRCEASGCRTLTPENVEIRLDFDRSAACIRRGGGRCRQDRTFTLVPGKGGARMVVFDRDGMVIRLGQDWSLVGTEVQSDRSSTYFGRCGRG